MDSLLPCDESKKSIFETDTLYRCNSLDKNTTFPPKQRSKSPSRQSEKRREDRTHVRFAKEPSLEFHIPECSEEAEDRESPLPILCSTLHPKPILKKTTPRKTHACTIIVYGEWGFVSLTSGRNELPTWRALMGPMTPHRHHNPPFLSGTYQQTQGTWARKDKMQYIHDFIMQHLYIILYVQEKTFR